MMSPSSSNVGPVSGGEMALAEAWASAKFAGVASECPFSFSYGGKASRELLAGWGVTKSQRTIDDSRIEHTAVYTDPGTGLLVRCVGVEYRDFPTVEWTVYFRNAGAEDTPILSEIEALDVRFERGSEGEVSLHHQRGSPCLQCDFEPFVTVLQPDQPFRLSPGKGRPSDVVLPYFNLAWGAGGVIVAVGWPGQWATEFARSNDQVSVRAGQELTHLKLHPGEEIRSPLIVLQFYNGDWVRAQNIWRRWMIAHNLPRPTGKLPPSHVAACSSHQFNEMVNADEESQKLFIDRYLAEGLKPDYWWMDAGWYPIKEGWWNTGTWEVDTKRFPRGLRAITDHARTQGIKSLVWFEPERVTPGSWLYQKHPEWLIGPEGDQKLLNLGDSDARRWLTDHTDNLLTQEGIDLYRQDFNMDPLDDWRSNDAADRQGMTENAHVTGYLAYWDELKVRHPEMLFDICASGGRRLDLETLRRSVPLHRSDYILEPVGQQAHTYAIAFWIPMYGTPVNATDPYVFRSQMCPFITTCWDVRRGDLDYPLFRRLIEEWRRLTPYYLGDYYPLTPYSLDDAVWMAWQFDRPDLGEGMVQAFRRSQSPYLSARFRLRGLDPQGSYTVRSLDAPAETRATGAELMDAGLPIEINDQPGAAIITYKRSAD